MGPKSWQVLLNFTLYLLVYSYILVIANFLRVNLPPPTLHACNRSFIFVTLGINYYGWSCFNK
jgi:hypothetical protein